MAESVETAWRARLVDLPEGVAPSFDLTGERTALLLIDMQYGSVHPDHELGRYYAVRMPEVGARYYKRVWDVVVPRQQRLLRFFRDGGYRVIFLTVGSEAVDGSDLNKLFGQRDEMIRAATGTVHSTWRGSPARQIISEIAPRPGELVLNKLSKGAFNSSVLDQVLHNMDIDGLVIAGVATNACVDSTARDASDRGYKCVLVADGCASNSTELHEATLINFQHLFGQVRTAEETIATLSQWSGGRTARFDSKDVRPQARLSESGASR